MWAIDSLHHHRHRCRHPAQLLAMPALMCSIAFVLVSFLALLLLLLLQACSHVLDVVWWSPRRQARLARLQGLHGPKPSFLLGNALHIKRLRESMAASTPPHSFPSLSRSHSSTVQQLLPDHVEWTQRYGKRHVIWWGLNALIVTTDMEILKEVLSSKHSLSLGKPTFLQRFLEPLTGIGLILANGETWAHERRIIGPAFHSDKLKGFARVMVKLTQDMAEKWYQKMEELGQAEVEVEEAMIQLTADIIAGTQFGSSYKRGKKVFEHLEELKGFLIKYGHLLIIPGVRYIPIAPFIRLRRMKSVIERSIQEIIEERRSNAKAGATDYGDDLLGLMLSESQRIGGWAGGSDDGKKQAGATGAGPQPLTMQQLVDECKTFFFAGHETTAQMLTWSLLLLAHDASWQERARAEVREVCRGEPPDVESANKMKIVEMILYETLRLFAPANSIVRAALCDMRIGDLFVPKGMCFWIPITAIHLDPELWGDDVYEFDPGRFAQGMSRAASHPMAFLPFAHGPRNCIGQSFALMEAKLVLATLLPRFSFAPSPAYRHSPQLVITTRPRFGAPVIVTKLQTGP